MMRYGDWVIVLNMILNLSAMLAYAWQGHWPNALYWLCAFGLNGALVWGMRQ